MHEISTVWPREPLVKIGDRVTIGGEPHSLMHHVIETRTDTFLTRPYRRPSRGFAKHIRRTKAHRK